MHPEENPVPEQPENRATVLPISQEQLEERMLRRIAQRPAILDELASRIESDEIVD